MHHRHYLVCVTLLLLSLRSLATPLQRFGHTAVILPSNGSMVVFGGHNFLSISMDPMEFTGLKNDIWRYDFNSSSWNEVLPRNQPPLPRVYHTAIVRVGSDGLEKMVITGGTTLLRYSGVRSTVYRACGREDVWEYDFTSGNWTEIVTDLGTCNSAFKPTAVCLLLYSTVLLNLVFFLFW